jgi:hypothetical protein
MDKKVNLSKNKKKNLRKYFSYKEAFKRIKSGINKGYYLEAITIEEGIITDRLISSLYGKGFINNLTMHNISKSKFSFYNIIGIWKTHTFPLKIEIGDYKDLILETDSFRVDRNICVHGLVKSFPGTPTMEVSNFLELAKLTAQKGLKLCRTVDKWHLSEKKKDFSIHRKK